MTAMALQMGLGMARRGGGAAFDPASLFAGGASGGFWKFSDSATLWQDTAGTTAVASDGDTIARADVQGGDHANLTQSVSAEEPVWKSSGGVNYAQFDGTNHNIRGGTDLITFGVCSYFCAVRTTDPTFMMANGGNRWIGAGQSGSGSLTYFSAGTPTTFIDEVQLSPETRGELYTVLADGNWHTVEIRSADLSAWTNAFFNIAVYSNGGFRFAGDIIDPLLIEDTGLDAGKRAQIAAYHRLKAGI